MIDFVKFLWFLLYLKNKSGGYENLQLIRSLLILALDQRSTMTFMMTFMMSRHSNCINCVTARVR